MSRTIIDLNIGTEVWLHETINGVEETVPYILVKRDSQGGVLLRKNCTEKKRMNLTNTTVYDGCEADVYLNDTETGFLSRFPAGELTCFQSRSISTFEYGDTVAHSISRRCYLLSQGEFFNSVPTVLEPEVGAIYSLLKYGKTFDFYSARVATLNGTGVSWWLRTPSSDINFYAVNNGGTTISYNASHDGYALRPALNVAPTTIVSDEGADKIYLITDGVTRIIDFDVKVLDLPNRPAKARVKYNANNLSNILVQVCNNYGDTNPDWVNATSMGEVTFTNTVKETADWQVGIRCYGESNGYGFIDEPDVFVTF